MKKLHYIAPILLLILPIRAEGGDSTPSEPVAIEQVDVKQQTLKRSHAFLIANGCSIFYFSWLVVVYSPGLS